MGLRGINATPKPTSRRGRPTAKLLHPWDAPGLSPCRKGHPLRQFAALHRRSARRHDPEIAAVAKTLHPRCLQDRQEPAIARSAPRCCPWPQERKNPARRRLVPVRLVWSRARAARRMLFGGLHERPSQARLRRDGGDHREDAVARQAHKHRALQARIGGHGQRLDVQRYCRPMSHPCMGCRRHSFATTSLRRCRTATFYDALEHGDGWPGAAIDDGHFDASGAR